MKSIRVPAVLDNLNTMIEFVLQILESTNVNSKYKNQIHLACEEALVNVIHYAYPDQVGHVEIQCEIREEYGDIWIKIIDEGVPYNPLAKVNPDISLDIKDRAIGGLGVYMYRTIMDHVSYEYKDNKNMLVLSKKLPS